MVCKVTVLDANASRCELLRQCRCRIARITNRETHLTSWSPREIHSFSSVIHDKAEHDRGQPGSGFPVEVCAATSCYRYWCAEKCSRKRPWRNSYREDQCNRIGSLQVRFRPSYRSFLE